ncbi:hypothetical protein GALL_505340 [mine drainage metagenome]|uniref:Uncharacterized protein n=1 Tax=mine drainage metagenome TaxID=410659 RepID=A0A1J5PRG8_9ZZZZ
MAFANRVVGTHFDRCRIAMIGNLLERHVFRNIHHHRTRTTTARNMKSLFHGLSHVTRIFDQKIMFDNRARNSHRIAFLESIHANGVRRHLTTDDHHRDTVHVRGSNASHGVGNARTGSDQRHTYVASGSRIAICSMHCGLFVTHQNMLNRILLEKCIINVQHGTTGVPPNKFDILSLQRFDQNLCTSEFLIALAHTRLRFAGVMTDRCWV